MYPYSRLWHINLIRVVRDTCSYLLVALEMDYFLIKRVSIYSIYTTNLRGRCGFRIKSSLTTN